MDASQIATRVLFLDIDGVLNSWEWWAKRTLEQRAFDTREGITGGIDPAAVARLNGVIARTGAAIVVSSSVRLCFDDVSLFAVLRSYGVVAAFAGVTPRLFARSGDGSHTACLPRADEIAAWLAEYPEVTTFAVIDDDSDVRSLPRIAARCVMTKMAHGLQDQHARRLVELLSGGPHE